MDSLSALGADIFVLAPVFFILGLPIAATWVQDWIPNAAYENVWLRRSLTAVYSIPAALVGGIFTAWIIFIVFDVIEWVAEMVLGLLPFDVAVESQAVFTLMLATGIVTGGVYFWIGKSYSQESVR